jgi:hypothetical protein
MSSASSLTPISLPRRKLPALPSASSTAVEDAVSRLLRVTEQTWNDDVSKASTYVEKQLTEVVSDRAMRTNLLQLKGRQAEEVVTIMQMVSLLLPTCLLFD